MRRILPSLVSIYQRNNVFSLFQVRLGLFEAAARALNAAGTPPHPPPRATPLPSPSSPPRHPPDSMAQSTHDSAVDLRSSSIEYIHERTKALHMCASFPETCSFSCPLPLCFNTLLQVRAPLRRCSRLHNPCQMLARALQTRAFAALPPTSESSFLSSTR